jgi:16S rRNA (uracil1498-N3)-methyltransferase
MRSAADAAPSFLYLPRLAEAPEAFELAAEDARYVARIVRAKPGERLSASDGAGLVAELSLEAVRPDVVVRVLRRDRLPAPPARVLLCGAPEGERGDWLVEKCAELGVTRLVPVHSERARWPEGARIERWQRLAVAALRQSCAARLMAIVPPVALHDAVAALPEGTRWLAAQEGEGALAVRAPAAGAIAGAVGPASGFSEGEQRSLTENAFLPVSLGSARLRTETAALAMAALWAAQSAAGPGRLDAPGPRP